MTSQTLTNERLANPSSSAVLAPTPEMAPLSGDSQQSRLLESMKRQYPADQQVKFLHLQAETESLLQQLKAIKQQRQAEESALAQSSERNLG